MLSIIAEAYSIFGLMAIFAAAATSVAVLGIALGVAKLVLVTYLHREWDTTPRLLKWYLSSAAVVLMLITSMGIFGYLSKAHLDQAVPAGNVIAELNIIDEKIKNEKDTIANARKALAQLDAQVDQVLGRSTTEEGASRSVAIRRAQQKERATLLGEIQSANARVVPLNDQRAKSAAEVRKVEAEVGPIKYVANLIYGDAADETALEKAVRAVIILLVSVFDPLAIALLLAWNRLNNAGVAQLAESLPSKQDVVSSNLIARSTDSETPRPVLPVASDSDIRAIIATMVREEPQLAPHIETVVRDYQKPVTPTPELQVAKANSVIRGRPL